MTDVKYDRCNKNHCKLENYQKYCLFEINCFFFQILLIYISVKCWTYFLIALENYSFKNVCNSLWIKWFLFIYLAEEVNLVLYTSVILENQFMLFIVLRGFLISGIVAN